MENMGAAPVRPCIVHHCPSTCAHITPSDQPPRPPTPQPPPRALLFFPLSMSSQPQKGCPKLPSPLPFFHTEYQPHECATFLSLHRLRCAMSGRWSSLDFVRFESASTSFSPCSVSRRPAPLLSFPNSWTRLTPLLSTELQELARVATDLHNSATAVMRLLRRLTIASPLG
jgi:hypothetical protein